MAVEDEPSRIETLFIRGRNVMLVRAWLHQFLATARAHAEEFKLERDPAHEKIFFEALAAFALHAGARPRGETLAWTLSIQNPLLNLFVAGDTDEDSVTGRVFTEHVKREKFNSFYQELYHAGKDLHRSFVDFTGRDAFLAAERFYEQSEQRPARYFQLGANRFAMLVAHPDYDADWFKAQEHSDIMQLDEVETLALIERRHVHWHCGCTRERIIQLLRDSQPEDGGDWFGEQTELSVSCPRCAAHYRVRPEDVEALDGEGI